MKTASEAALLKEFGLVSEESLAKLLGVKVKTLKNRPRDKLPEFVKKGLARDAALAELFG